MQKRLRGQGLALVVHDLLSIKELNKVKKSFKLIIGPLPKVNIWFCRQVWKALSMQISEVTSNKKIY